MNSERAIFLNLTAELDVKRDNLFEFLQPPYGYNDQKGTLFERAYQ